MCTSDTTEPRNKEGKAALAYLVTSAVCALFGAIYEHFSHGVYSYYMIYAFAFPLCMGALPFEAMSVAGKKNNRSAAADNLWHCAAATLTAGSIVRGALEIYGTSNRLVGIYPAAGIALALSALIITVIMKFRGKPQK